MARNSASPKPAQSGSTRCAIYTRKSSEDGLELEFNSLDAQREACLAYITSQRHEGWKALPTHYDDGGFSGGTLNRPAVQRLLADIRDGNLAVSWVTAKRHRPQIPPNMAAFLANDAIVP